MARRPEVKTLTTNSVDILNAIRNNATQNYREYIPQATQDGDSIRAIGSVIMNNPSLQNEFLSALVNRIGRVIITSKMYSNPWNMFKKGMLEFGETIEEIFVNIAKPFQYDPEVASQEVFKREIPDVRTAFHVRNYTKFYKSTIQQEDLKTAFLSWQGINDLISKIVDAMYTGANYDEFQVMKYMIAKQALNGFIKPIVIPNVTTSSLPEIVAKMREISNDFEMLTDIYNLTGVMQNCMKSDQYIIVSNAFDSKMSVEVLATAFNMDKAELLGRRVMIDGFGRIDNKRLAELFKDDPNYVELTQEELTALNTIPALLVDGDWWQVYDNKMEFTEQYNAQGLYWNYFYHVWKTFSVSPFVNNALFVTGEPVVTSVAVSPSTLTMVKGQSAQLGAQVVTENFASKAVKWSVDSEVSHVTPTGTLVVASTEPKASLTVTCTSIYDETKTGTCVVTLVG